MQIGTGMNLEKDTVGFLCLNRDVETTGSTVGQVTGHVEHDTFGYVQR